MKFKLYAEGLDAWDSRQWMKIDANTERIFKLQQQNMKLREEIRKLQRGE